MADMMTFPDTWEEFEECYGITDREQIYTNGARLIPSFRVKQWLDHTAEQTEPQRTKAKSIEDMSINEARSEITRLKAYTEGYQKGKEDEHRWWSNHCANCTDYKDEPQIEVIACPIIDDDAWIYEDEPQTDCRRCKHYATGKCKECFGYELFADNGYVTDCSWR